MIELSAGELVSVDAYPSVCVQRSRFPAINDGCSGDRIGPNQTGEGSHPDLSVAELPVGLENNVNLCVEQFKEFLGTYNKLTENCFMDCVKDFTTRDVKPEEVTGSFNTFIVLLPPQTSCSEFFSSSSSLRRPAVLRVASRST